MKILEDYKKIAQELLFEVDDEKMIKYKDKDGESKEMKAGSAKTMPKDHPAKQAWDKMAAQDAGDDSGAEKEKGQKIGGSDFDRDDTFGGPGSEVDKYLKSLRGKPGYDDEDDEGDIDIAKGKAYGGRGFGDDDGKEYYDIEGDDTMGHLSPEEQQKLVKLFNPEQLRHSSGHEPNRNDLSVDSQGNVRFGDPNDPDRPGDGDIVAQIKDDTTHDELKAMITKNAGQIMDKYYKQFGAYAKDAKKLEPIAGGGDDSGDSDDEENYSVRLSMEIDDAVKSGKLPKGAHQQTKLKDIDEDALEDFYGEFTYDIAKEYDITQEIFANDEMYHLDDIAKKGGTLKDMYDSVISSAEEYAADEGTRKFDENKKPKKKPFLREQLERFGGGRY